MQSAPFKLKKGFWDNFKVEEVELDFIYYYLLDIETPQTSLELTIALVKDRIDQEIKSLEKNQKSLGEIFLPEKSYKTGQRLIFPSFDHRSAKVTMVREGTNPDIPPFQVIEVLFDDNGDKLQFAAALENHLLNVTVAGNPDDPQLNIDAVMEEYGDRITKQVSDVLENNQDLVRIADRWFPKALLVDVNVGYLNLAEALLDMEKGGPLPTKTILEQIDLPTDVNSKLTEFSLDYALQVDERFDEVGPVGEVLWFLHRYEPEFVQNTPEWLRYHPYDYDRLKVESLLSMFDDQIADELEPDLCKKEDKETTICLIYPHWRAGTLPLSDNVKRLFPTAFESPRVKFSFVDGKSGEKFPGWVVRQSLYVFGLYEWYHTNGLIPGSLVTIQQGKKPGEVGIRAKTHRPTREWIRTILVGSDGGIVFAMLKQLISSDYNERMTIYIPDPRLIDEIWKNPSRQKKSLEQTMRSIMRELVKLNPQGNVHAEEIYAAANIISRFPPGQMLSILTNSTWATHLGDLYFRFSETQNEEKKDD